MAFASDQSYKYALKLTCRITTEQHETAIKYSPFSVSATDPRRWHLVSEGKSGRLQWTYLNTDDCKEQDETSRFFLDIPISIETIKAKCPSQALANGAHFHSQLQVKNSGCWAADLSCIFFVTPMLVMAWYITEAPVPEAYAIELVRHFLEVQDKEDHGWPTHLEGPSTLMTTVLIYVALRLIGLPADHVALIKARRYILDAGGAICLPAWAKFWLCLLNLYEWDAADPYPAEIWLLPDWNPLNPWRWFCIVRQVSLCMSYLSARRFKIFSNPLLDEIREEIFAQPYSSIDFTKTSTNMKIDDRHQHKSWPLQRLDWLLVNVWEPWLRPNWMARRAEQKALELIRLSDRSSDSIGLISVDEFLTMICFYAADGRGTENVRRVQRSSFEYLFMNSKGMQVMSIHGGHAWETALALQSYASAGLAKDPKYCGVVQNAHKFLVNQQLCDEWSDAPPTNRFSRLGGWSFTVRYHGQPCSDCTAEALKAILMVEAELPNIEPLGEAKTRLAVDNLLLIQNQSGGYSSFEPIRGGAYLENLNGTEIFGNVMVEYDYTECTASCLLALMTFQKHDSNYRSKDIERAITRGVSYIRKQQREDGSWVPHWGLGFTYAGMFAIETLAAMGETYENSPTVKKGCDFLLSKMKVSGGWGETVDSILQKTYTQAEKAHTVQTAWACLALMYANCPQQAPIKAGIRLIMERQQPNGEWPQETRCGAGILTVLILYHNYMYTFPIRALNEYIQRYGDEDLSVEQRS